MAEQRALKELENAEPRFCARITSVTRPDCGFAKINLVGCCAVCFGSPQYLVYKDVRVAAHARASNKCEHTL